MKIPIVAAAFGTTSRAFKTYSFIDEKLKEYFPGHEIYWAYSSRMIKDLIKKRHNIDVKPPGQVLSELSKRGHIWAVIQSFHLLCGHEFYRLVEEVKQSPIRTSIGLPLLCSPEDYEAAAYEIMKRLPDTNNEAAILIGHGTDHPCWTSYAALLHCLRKGFAQGIFVGVIDGDYMSREKIVEEVIRSGFKKVRLIPFMLVAGMHFLEDLSGDKDSWKTVFQEKGISVTVETDGLGFNSGIIEIFLRHIQDAIEVIPS